MHRSLPALSLLLVWAGAAQSRGLLIPEDRKLPPLAMLNHKVSIQIEDQAAVTSVEQVFRNHTDRALEATYVFPVPKGASVNEFVLWVDGKKVNGELVEAQRAREVYTEIVRRTQDPGLLEYVDGNLLRLRVFPVPARGEQKVALRYTSVTARESGLVEYVYPLKRGRGTPTIDDFSIRAKIQAQHGVQNVYSPTHAITLKRNSDRDIEVHFTQKQGLLDRDFQLFYQLGDRDVGLTALAHRPSAEENGSFLMLIAPQLKMAKENRAPRDLVLVLDTSGSMAGEKFRQAQKALHHCLGSLSEKDRFGLVGFATTVDKYRDGLVAATRENVASAKKWVDEMEANGGTAIYDALEAALGFRGDDESRSFTVVFFTDGLPTVGDGDKIRPEVILRDTVARNTANTRIFTFGVGDDVNATLLDQLAYKTRARPTYVRPQEDLEVKVSGMVAKISHPVLTNLKLATTGDVRLLEVYPPQLPDLFHGSQLVVLGRYSGKGPTAIKLTGSVGKETKEFVCETTFPEKTAAGREFVEHLWARRKVGYLLDQVRANGENKELVGEVVALAKKYSITTPYTSLLVIPDEAVLRAPPAPKQDVPNVGFGGVPGGQFGGQFGNLGRQFGLMGQFGQFGGQFGIGGFGGFQGGPPPAPGFGGGLAGFGGGLGGFPGFAPGMPGQFGQFGQFGLGGGQFGQFGGIVSPAPGGGTGDRFRPNMPSKSAGPAVSGKVLDFARALRKAGFDGTALVMGEGTGKAEQQEALRQLALYVQAREALAQGQQAAVQSGKLGVDLSVELGKLRDLHRLGALDQRKAAGQVFQRVGDVWIDTAFKEKAPTLVVKAQGDAYFRILERHAPAKEVLRLGNRLVWMTPSGMALVVDPGDGKEKLDDKEIDRLFVGGK